MVLRIAKVNQSIISLQRLLTGFRQLQQPQSQRESQCLTFLSLFRTLVFPLSGFAVKHSKR